MSRTGSTLVSTSPISRPSTTCRWSTPDNGAGLSLMSLSCSKKSFPRRDTDNIQSIIARLRSKSTSRVNRESCRYLDRRGWCQPICCVLQLEISGRSACSKAGSIRYPIFDAETSDVSVLHRTELLYDEQRGRVHLLGHHWIHEVLLIVFQLWLPLLQVRSSLYWLRAQLSHGKLRTCCRELISHPEISSKSIVSRTVRLLHLAWTVPSLGWQPGHHEMVGRRVAPLRLCHLLFLPLPGQVQPTFENSLLLMPNGRPVR